MPDADERYEIVAGERRWRAAQIAGCHELPVVVYALSDREALEVALLENVQRQDLSPLEEADGYRRLIEEFGHTQEELARALGKSRSHIANLIRLLGLPAPVRVHARRRRAVGRARPRAAQRARSRALARQVVAMDSMCGRLRRWCATRRQTVRPSGPEPRDADTLALERDLSGRLGLRVS